jgi:hypothetical protein
MKMFGPRPKFNKDFSGEPAICNFKTFKNYKKG